MTTRREFIGSALAAAAVLPGLLPAGAARADAPIATRVLMDWHSHYVSKAEIKFLAARKQAPRLLTGADGLARLQNVTTVSAEAGEPSEFATSNIATRLNNLDRNGIARQLLTHTVALGFDATLPLDELRPLYRAFNDELAQIVSQHPT